jgi:hypothetical protein
MMNKIAIAIAILAVVAVLVKAGVAFYQVNQAEKGHREYMEKPWRPLNNKVGSYLPEETPPALSSSAEASEDADEPAARP